MLRQIRRYRKQQENRNGTTTTEKQPKIICFFHLASELGSAVAKLVVEHVLHDTLDCECPIRRGDTICSDNIDDAHADGVSGRKIQELVDRILPLAHQIDWN